MQRKWNVAENDNPYRNTKKGKSWIHYTHSSNVVKVIGCNLRDKRIDEKGKTLYFDHLRRLIRASLPILFQFFNKMNKELFSDDYHVYISIFC